MEKIGAFKERRAREIISEITSSSKSEMEANIRLLQSNDTNDENTVRRLNKLMDEERNPKCQYLEDYYRYNPTYCYINSRFDLKPALMNNLARGFPDRLDRKSEQLQYLSKFSNEHFPEDLFKEMVLENTLHRLSKSEYLQSRLVTTFDRSASSGSSTTFNNIFLSTKNRSLSNF